MYRGGLFMVAGLLLGLVLFLGTRDFTVSGGVAPRTTARDYTCGSSIGVVFFDTYDPEIEGPFLLNSCSIAARDRTVTHVIFVVLGLGAIVAGLIRGPAPPVRDIRVLAPLPKPGELGRRWSGSDIDDWADS